MPGNSQDEKSLQGISTHHSVENHTDEVNSESLVDNLNRVAKRMKNSCALKKRQSFYA
jgi:hypothetical protein